MPKKPTSPCSPIGFPCTASGTPSVTLYLQCGCCAMSSFITKPQHGTPKGGTLGSCVISSFITKPQHPNPDKSASVGCVISSFITKPQQLWQINVFLLVALYLLSSPNHNLAAIIALTLWLRYIFFHHQTTTNLMLFFVRLLLRYIFFHHQTTTLLSAESYLLLLRYIFFHHQTTTFRCTVLCILRCVISSFITKPQPLLSVGNSFDVALYLLSSPNHNLITLHITLMWVALYLLSSPNHNLLLFFFPRSHVALYLLSSPNHNQGALL